VRRKETDEEMKGISAKVSSLKKQKVATKEETTQSTFFYQQERTRDVEYCSCKIRIW
jgi:uncharacterized protein YdcH (DUF465 family)